MGTWGAAGRGGARWGSRFGPAWAAPGQGADVTPACGAARGCPARRDRPGRTGRDGTGRDVTARLHAGRLDGRGCGVQFGLHDLQGALRGAGVVRQGRVHVAGARAHREGRDLHEAVRGEVTQGHANARSERGEARVAGQGAPQATEDVQGAPGGVQAERAVRFGRRHAEVRASLRVGRHGCHVTGRGEARQARGEGGLVVGEARVTVERVKVAAVRRAAQDGQDGRVDVRLGALQLPGEDEAASVAAGAGQDALLGEGPRDDRDGAVPGSAARVTQALAQFADRQRGVRAQRRDDVRGALTLSVKTGDAHALTVLGDVWSAVESLWSSCGAL